MPDGAVRRALFLGVVAASAVALFACGSDGDSEGELSLAGADISYDEANAELLDTLPIPPGVEEVSRSARRSPVSEGRILVAVYGLSEEAQAADVLSFYQETLEESGWLVTQGETRSEFERGEARVIVDVSSLANVGQYAVAVDHGFGSGEDSP